MIPSNEQKIEDKNILCPVEDIFFGIELLLPYLNIFDSRFEKF
jgi:hypothetical protein